MTVPLLELAGIGKRFHRGGAEFPAVDGVDLVVHPGETLALVGPSGSGKSTLARIVARLTSPDAGTIRFEGDDWLRLSGRALRARRARLQMVFQDPLAAFNPRATVRRLIADPLRIHRVVPRGERQNAVAALLERVGLDPALASRAVHEISGGQRQRVAIARAVATTPALLILDEAVSALDVSVRAKILELLVGLQRERNIAYLFISHDLAVVRAVSHRVAVLDAGRIVETGEAAEVIDRPQSETARLLVAAVPILNRATEGSPP